jgi:hypothetical protein
MALVQTRTRRDEPEDFRDRRPFDPTMGVQPPSNDIDEGPDVIEFGIAALDARLEELDVSFPTDAESLRSEYGSLAVPIDAAGTEITLVDALEATDQKEFDTEQDLLNALHPVFERRREKASRSLLAQLRALVPF